MSTPTENNSPTDNNNNNNNKADIIIPSAAAERRRYNREALLNQFSDMLRTQATIPQICQRFRISRGTYYRWIDRLGARDKKFMEHNYDNIIINEINTTVDQLKYICQVMNNILMDKSMETTDRVEAGKLAAEAQVGILRVYQDGPTAVWSKMPTATKQIVNEEYYAAAVKESKTVPELTDKRLNEIHEEVEHEREQRRQNKQKGQ